MMPFEVSVRYSVVIPRIPRGKLTPERKKALAIVHQEVADQYQSIDRQLYKAAGRHSHSSGFGGGVRDHQWSCEDRATAQKLTIKFRAIKGVRAKIVDVRAEFVAARKELFRKLWKCNVRNSRRYSRKQWPVQFRTDRDRQLLGRALDALTIVSQKMKTVRKRTPA